MAGFGEACKIDCKSSKDVLYDKVVDFDLRLALCYYLFVYEPSNRVIQ